MKIQNLLVNVGLILAAIGMPALAAGLESQAADVKLGLFALTPSVGAEVKHDDNIYTTNSSEVSSWITAETISVNAVAEPSRHRIEFEYAGEFGQYSENSDDNFSDHTFTANGSFAIGRRVHFDVGGFLDMGHQARGSGLSAGRSPDFGALLNEPDEFDSQGLRSTLTIGNEDSRGRLKIQLGIRDIEFTNNRERTRIFSRDRSYSDVAYYHRILPRTSFVIDARLTDIEYEEERALGHERDSQEERYRVGLTWKATAKTSGSMRVGYLDKEFDDGDLSGFSGISWELNVRWSPRTYSHIDVNTSREPDEPTDGLTEFVDRKSYGIGWTHAWSDRLETSISAEFRNDEFQGSPRDEDYVDYALQVSYRIWRWLTLELRGEVADLTSPLDRFEYAANRFSIGAKLTL